MFSIKAMNTPPGHVGYVLVQNFMNHPVHSSSLDPVVSSIVSFSTSADVSSSSLKCSSPGLEGKSRWAMPRPCSSRFVFSLISFTTLAALTKSVNLRNKMLMAAWVRSTLLILCLFNTASGIRVSMDMLKAKGKLGMVGSPEDLQIL